jgi:hypothetical protein
MHSLRPNPKIAAAAAMPGPNVAATATTAATAAAASRTGAKVKTNRDAKLGHRHKTAAAIHLGH